MTRKFCVLVISLLAAPAVSAQETYSVPLNAVQVTRMSRGVTISNAMTCEQHRLAVNCTQAQACTAAGAVGGAACTPAQARDVSARIYPQTFAGREEFFIFVLALGGVNDLRNRAIAFDQQSSATRWQNMTQVQRNAICNAHVPPLGDNCDLH